MAAGVAAAALLAVTALAAPAAGAGVTAPALLAGAANPAPDPHPESCAAPAGVGTDPHRVEMQATARALGSRASFELRTAPSPFDVTVSRDGHLVYDVRVEARQLRRLRDGVYVAWATTPELDQVEKLGTVEPGGRAEGRVLFNKFIVLITAESSPEVEAWSGPVVLTGLSPSGLMHTMRGHGIFEAHGVGC